jgi:hypothetical protein
MFLAAIASYQAEKTQEAIAQFNRNLVQAN